MTLAIRFFATIAAVFAGATAVMAHPGHHEGMSFAELGSHMVASADHVLIVLVSLAALSGLVGWRVIKSMSDR